MRLVEIRATRAISVRQLARLARVSPHTIHGIERGQVAPMLVTIRKLSDALGVEPIEVDEFRAVIERIIRGDPAALATA